MTTIEKKEWLDYLNFLEDAVSDSPHSGDDMTMEWHYRMMPQLKTLVLGEQEQEPEQD